MEGRSPAKGFSSGGGRDTHHLQPYPFRVQSFWSGVVLAGVHPLPKYLADDDASRGISLKLIEAVLFFPLLIFRLLCSSARRANQAEGGPTITSFIMLHYGNVAPRNIQVLLWWRNIDHGFLQTLPDPIISCH